MIYIKLLKIKLQQKGLDTKQMFRDILLLLFIPMFILYLCRFISEDKKEQ